MPPQQWQLQKQLPAALSPSSGIQVKPLSCENPKPNANGTTAQVIKTDQGTLLIDEGNGGLFSSEQLTVSLNDDGTGVLVTKLDKQTSFTVYGSNNGKGSYVGLEGRFDINDDGSGTWRKGNTTVTIHKNGSATLHDDRGLLTIKPDGSVNWQRRGGNVEYIENFAMEQVCWAALIRLKRKWHRGKFPLLSRPCPDSKTSQTNCLMWLHHQSG